jgi:peptidoglycan/LPS O-acetylase OafA/YrhL
MNAAPPAYAQFRPDIAGLRALAIAAVVLYHLGSSWADGGFVGLDMFLVISGFVITRQLVDDVDRAGAVRLGRFWAHRLRRLVPAVTVMLCVVAAWTLAVASPDGRRRTGADIASAAVYVLDWRIEWSDPYLATPVQPLWSLAVEMQFYLAWSCVLAGIAIMARGRSAARIRWWWAITAAGAALSFAWAIVESFRNPHDSYFSPMSRGWEFLAGAALAFGLTRTRQMPPTVATALGWVAIAALPLSTALAMGQSAWPSLITTVPVATTAAVIAAGSARESAGAGVGGLLGLPPFQWLGRISYALFLWHWPVLWFAASHGYTGRLDRLAVLMLSVLLAWVTTRFIEEPIRSVRIDPRTTYVASAAAIGVTLCFGLSLWLG